MFHDIQAPLDMLQRSHNLHILILFFETRDEEIYNPLGSVPLFKRFAYSNKTQPFNALGRLYFKDTHTHLFCGC